MEESSSLDPPLLSPAPSPAFLCCPPPYRSSPFPPLLQTPPLFLQDKYTVWDTLTASLCAIVHDNLPLELLNQPFHTVAEVPSPIVDPSATDAQESNKNGPSPSSPAWMDTGRPSSSEVHVLYFLCFCTGVRCISCTSGVSVVPRSLGGVDQHVLAKLQGTRGAVQCSA